MGIQNFKQITSKRRNFTSHEKTNRKTCKLNGCHRFATFAQQMQNTFTPGEASIAAPRTTYDQSTASWLDCDAIRDSASTWSASAGHLTTQTNCQLILRRRSVVKSGGQDQGHRRRFLLNIDETSLGSGC